MSSSGIVYKGKPDQFPAGAVLLTEKEAVSKQWELLNSWTPKSDIWPFRYSHFILSSFSGYSAFQIINYYRRRLQLGTYGRFTMQLPTVLLPSLVSGILHLEFVSSSILVQKDCPVCIQLRSTCFQLASAVVIPSILSPLVTFGYAYKYSGMLLPDLKMSNLGEIFRLYWKITKKYQRSFAYLTAANALLATYITYKEGTSFCDLQIKLIDERQAMEKQINKAMGVDEEKALEETNSKTVANDSSDQKPEK